MQNVTLGGERLGSGEKMKVGMTGFQRSNHNLGFIWRSTMSAGTLVPFMNYYALPGGTMDIDLDVDVKTLPTVGPLFGSYKVQLDVFQTPLRLYNSLLHNNALEIGLDMSQVKLPQIELTALAIDKTTVSDIDNCQINPSCVLKYLGLSGIGFTDATSGTQTRQFNAVHILNYWDVYKNYYSNKNEKIGAVIHCNALTFSPQTILNGQVTAPDGTQEPLLQVPNIGDSRSVPLQLGTFISLTYIGGSPLPEQIMLNLDDGQTVSFAQLMPNWTDTGTSIDGYIGGNNMYMGRAILNWDYSDSTTALATEPRVQTFDLENIDTMRSNILGFNSKTTPFVLNTDGDITPYNYLWAQPNGMPNILCSQEGLGLKTYQSDLFNNWLDTAWMNDISSTSAVSTVGNQFTIDSLILANKVFDMLNRIAVSGGSYNDWLDVVYAEKRMRRPESPVYMGGLIRDLVFQEVVSNSLAETQPLGTLAGKGVMSGKRIGGKIVIKTDEPSIIMGIVSLTPQIDYSQGNEWYTGLLTMDDLHKPSLDEIGFQDLITEQMAWWDTYYDTGWTQRSAGKQPAWVNYMTETNKTKGNFAIANNQMFMTLNRRYEFDTTNEDIQDLTTYIDPSKFNFIFAQTSLDSQNFWVQIGVRNFARRKMSAKIMPNL